MLKLFEVLVLVMACACFVVWQFRDLRRSREITRKQREAEQAQSTHATSQPRVSVEEVGSDGG
jgi:flagellar biogenesis protein FliO